jgi:hypothetical protein
MYELDLTLSDIGEIDAIDEWIYQARYPLVIY